MKTQPFSSGNRLLLASPLGPLGVLSNDTAWVGLVFHPDPRAFNRQTPTTPLEREIARCLARYFSGQREAFQTLPLDISGGTPFQQAVWEALREIPYGETRSYAELAQTISNPDASRAVGQANRRNPLPIVVPCHRVMSSDGGLGGYQGVQGLWIKRFLLDLEGAGSTLAPSAAGSRTQPVPILA